eukprot:scaffold139032_cov157-Phaeocystis_antarctica.AAC.1
MDGGFIYGTISMLCTDKIRTLYTRDSFVYDRFVHRQQGRAGIAAVRCTPWCGCTKLARFGVGAASGNVFLAVAVCEYEVNTYASQADFVDVDWSAQQGAIVSYAAAADWPKPHIGRALSYVIFDDAPTCGGLHSPAYLTRVRGSCSRAACSRSCTCFSTTLRAVQPVRTV